MRAGWERGGKRAAGQPRATRQMAEEVTFVSKDRKALGSSQEQLTWLLNFRTVISRGSKLSC